MCIVSGLVTLGAVNQALIRVRILDLERSARAAARQEERAWLAVVEPIEGERMAVRIARAFGAEVDALAGLHGQLVRVRELDDGRMIGLGVGLDRPVHARGEVVLIRRAPAPDRRLVAGVPAAVHAEDFVFGVAPERPGFRLVEPLPQSRRVELVAAAPTAPVRVLRIAKAVVDEMQETRRVAFHQEFCGRVLRAERSLAADVADRARDCPRS